MAGDPACWLEQVCAVCGRVADDPTADLDEDRRCSACRQAAEGER